MTTYLDVAASGGSPLLHFLQSAKHEGRQPTGRSASLAEIIDASSEDLKPWFAPLDAYAAWLSVSGLTPNAIKDLRSALEERSGRLPSVSLVTRCTTRRPRSCANSSSPCAHQVYDDWELCLVDDGSPASHVRPLLSELASLDARIRVIARDRKRWHQRRHERRRRGCRWRRDRLPRP